MDPGAVKVFSWYRGHSPAETFTLKKGGGGGGLPPARISITTQVGYTDLDIRRT